MTARRARITEIFAALEEECAPDPSECISFAGGRYLLRVANSLKSREKAYRLAYKLYLEKEYAQPHPSRMWLSIFDALPGTTTLLVERAADGIAVGALTVVFDSPMGLPADGLYKPELDALRAKGRRLCEFCSLAVAEEGAAGNHVLVELYSCMSIYAREVKGATDIVITINPRHAGFYARTLLFEDLGPERSYDKVGGAPAVLQRLDFEVQKESIRREHESSGDINLRRPAHAETASSEPTALASQRGGSLCPPNSARRSRVLYRLFHPLEEDATIAGRLDRAARPMSERELGYFFVAKTTLWLQATPEQRACLQGRYPAYDLDSALLPVTSGLFSRMRCAIVQEEQQSRK